MEDWALIRRLVAERTYVAASVSSDRSRSRLRGRLHPSTHERLSEVRIQHVLARMR